MKSAKPCFNRVLLGNINFSTGAGGGGMGGEEPEENLAYRQFK